MAKIARSSSPVQLPALRNVSERREGLAARSCPSFVFPDEHRTQAQSVQNAAITRTGGQQDRFWTNGRRSP